MADRPQILIISNYFAPEKGAAPRRITSLAESFAENGVATRVLVPLPNYPDGKVFKDYRGSWLRREKHGAVQVDRLFIYPSNSRNPLLRVLSMLSFAFSLLVYMPLYARKGFPKVIVQSPPLFVSFAAVFISKYLLKKEVILNVSDLWPMSAVELGVLSDKGRMFRLLEWMERFIYRRCDRVSGQSEEIIEHIKGIRPAVEAMVYRNLPKINREVPIHQPIFRSENRRIVYAGLLGFAQGIARICKEVDFPSLGLEFHIYGMGMEEEEIIAFCKQHPSSNITFHGSVDAKEMPAILSQFDAALVPLTNRIYGAVPSKIYELIQVGLPIIFSGGGEGASIIEEHQIGITTPPGDLDGINKALMKFANLETSGLLLMQSKMQSLSTGLFDYHNQFIEFQRFALKTT